MPKTKVAIDAYGLEYGGPKSFNLWEPVNIRILPFREMSTNLLFTAHTTQNSQNMQTKILGLETNIFCLKMMMKSVLEFLISKFQQPLQIYLLFMLARFNPSGKIFLHWAAATLEQLVEFQNKKFQTTFHDHF